MQAECRRTPALDPSLLLLLKVRCGGILSGFSITSPPALDPSLLLLLKVRCGGIFSGFSITSSSSSTSHWASSSTEGSAATATVGNLSHRRSKSWGWTFASPMRAFSKPSKRDSSSSNKNATPNLASIPSLLAAGVVQTSGVNLASTFNEGCKLNQTLSDYWNLSN